MSFPEKTLVFSDGHKGTEGTCWEQGGCLFSLADPEAVGCKRGAVGTPGEQERASPAAQREQSSLCEHA